MSLIADILGLVLSVQFILLGLDLPIAYKLMKGDLEKNRLKFQKGNYPYIFLALGALILFTSLRSLLR